MRFSYKKEGKESKQYTFERKSKHHKQHCQLPNDVKKERSKARTLKYCKQTITM
jgi:hypothetical protein